MRKVSIKLEFLFPFLYILQNEKIEMRKAHKYEMIGAKSTFYTHLHALFVHKTPQYARI